MSTPTEFLDISVRDFTGNFTQKAHGFGVKTQILVKAPAVKLTTVRLMGTRFTITEFLRFMCVGLGGHWTEAMVQMHQAGIHELTEDGKAPLWKNRGLLENRQKAL